ncbi:MAG: Kdo hydroxylase family protein [Pantoea sp.]|uniref:Kdo hydroxylase family protein n=1 Tax=Pantoea sp. TaxID=69393 RepID=UPI0023884C9D|nr:Kdo hydroxylase family protein [Pantoea sp.]MDE1185462.1 Kdo hydroxylase family protein [Pantoea sp.]
MPEITTSYDNAIYSLPLGHWNSDTDLSMSAVDALEKGKVIFLPNLSFSLTDEEMLLLDPALVDPKRKNISYQPLKDKLTGVATAMQEPAISLLLQRHYQACLQLIAAILPEYQQKLHSPTNSLRLHPVKEWTQNTSWRKDDRRLHVDAFPSRPNYGERILRIFTNINPTAENRSWRVGETFPTLAQRFLPRLKGYSPLLSRLQYTFGITKSLRSHYDHLMLQLHDAMKADADYQKNGPQIAIEFPSGSSWICFSDGTPHAAMGGQFMLEQTFLLPVDAMHEPKNAPLKILESILHKSLI